MNTRRWGIVYGIPVYHPDTGQVVLGYVGQTRQRLAARFAQHEDEQLWADTIAGPVFILEQGVWDDDELDRREIAAIERLLPLYNIEHNMANPYRIPPWTAREQAAQRGRTLRSQPIRDGRRSRPFGRPRSWAMRRLRVAFYVGAVAAVAASCGAVTHVVYLLAAR